MCIPTPAIAFRPTAGTATAESTPRLLQVAGVELQEPQGRPHGVDAEHRDRRVDRAVGSDAEGERGEQLRHVGVEAGLGDGHLAEAEVDQPRLVEVVEDDVRAAEVAVRDAVRPQDRHLLPHCVQERVVDRVGVEAVEGPSVDVVVGEEHRVGPDLGDRAQPRRPHADVARLQRRERLVLDRAPQGDEGALVAHVLQAQPAVQAEEEVLRALGGGAHLHHELGAVVDRGEEVARAAPRRRHRSEPGHREAGRRQARDHRSRARVLVGRRPHRSVRGDTARGADGEGEEDLGRELGRQHDAHRHERCGEDDARPPPAGPDEGPEDHEARGERGDAGGGDGGADVHAGPLGEDVGDPLLLPRLDELHGRAGERAGHDVADDEIAEEAVAAQHERRRQDADRRDQPEELRGAVEEAGRRRLQEVECVHRVALEAEERVVRVAGDEQQEQRGRAVHEQAQHVRRRARVPDDLLDLEMGHAADVAGDLVGAERRRGHERRSLAHRRVAGRASARCLTNIRQYPRMRGTTAGWWESRQGC
jgi:hypothetical protein